MRVGIIISLAASALLGLGAMALAKMWMPAASTTPGVSAARDTAPVVVAAAPLKFGTRLAAKDLAVVRLPSNGVPVGAYSTIAALLDQAGGAPVVLAPIAEREPLLASKLSGPGARPSLAAEIADGKRAYTIRVTDVTGVGGHALPGDRVDVVITRDLSEETRSRQMLSEVVIQNARVLGIDLNADLASTKPNAPRTATLEVSVEDAQKLAVAAELGSLSLALRRSGAAEISDVRPISTRDVGAQGAVPVPRASPALAPAAARRQTGAFRASAPASAGTSVVIVHGEKTALVSVTSEKPGAGA